MTTSHEILSDLMGVLNEDKDGGWFICAEAAEIIRRAEEHLAEHASGTAAQEPVATLTILVEGGMLQDILADSNVRVLLGMVEFLETDSKLHFKDVWHERIASC